MSELAQVLRHVAPVDDPNALVGYSTGDDAAVYRISADRAMVVTADFFTPIVDDPYDFGRIAAANALSDIYAMGARPLFVLNLVAFPRKLLGEGILETILRGGSEVAREAGVPTLGGHSIDDPEPKYGMVAVGEVHPDRMVTNAAAQPGNVLVLTKPIGSGVIATAIKEGKAPSEVVANAVAVMATLNRGAAEAMVKAGAHAATDITGFGLLGHLHRMLVASGVAAHLRAEAVPLLDGARELAAAGHVPGGTKRNLADLAEHVDFAETVDATARTLLGDAQTSGGLLIAVPGDRVATLLREIDGKAPCAAVIGSVLAGRPGHIQVE
ncbi:MAG: selenide, water dikinase SelD [Gemmatimonadetes bacterium]|nr:selenide, water dikinase SelD [Gemmatimonadota bacterium]